MIVKLPPLPEARKPDENGAGWFTLGQLAEVQREAYLAALDEAAQVCDSGPAERQTGSGVYACTPGTCANAIRALRAELEAS